MASRVTIHIGTPKSGTTYVQGVLFANKDRLAEHGVLLPAGTANEHALAAIGMRNGPEDTYASRWEALLAEVAAWDGPAIISNEWFGMAGPERTAEAIERLQGIGELHVVLTARDLVDQVPAAWQETLKLGDSTQIDAFVDKLEVPDFRWGWWDIDPAEVLSRWAPHVPAERLHVVTIPPRGAPSDVLWHRFAEACAIDAGWCSTEVTFARQSLSVEGARLLQLAGPRLLDAIDATPPHWNGPRKWIQSHLSHGMLLRHRGGRITMSLDKIDAVRERSVRSIETIEASGCTVHGDLADLTSSRLPEGATHPDDVADSVVLDLAIDVIAEQLGRARKVANRAQVQAKVQPPDAPGPKSAGRAMPLRRALGRARRAVRGD